MRRLSARGRPCAFQQDPQAFGEAIRQLQEYFRGGRRRFHLPLDLWGTEFQVQVWKALMEIPFGETRSYRDVADRVGRPLAVRAVGQANGRNPIPVIVPCHRVIRASGDLGGYGGGLDLKMRLLELEAGPR
jgi:O-6-methylguanine DNA methyltransferase